MSVKTMAALGWSSALAALGCIMAGLPLMKRGSSAGLPLVIAFVALIAVTIILLVFSEKQQRGD